MKINRKWKICFLIFMVLAVALSMSGCRESLVLAKIIHDQQAQEVDKENDTKVAQNDEQSNVEDNQLSKKKDSSDSTRKQGYKKVASKRGSKKNAGEASKIKQDPDSNSNDKADTRKNNKDAGDDNKAKGPGKPNGDNNNTGTPDGPGQPNGNKEIMGPDNQKHSIPKNVKYVVAPGESAVMAEMLGGKGTVIGTSASVKDNALTMQVFGDDGLQDAETLWDGDGSSPMSDAAFDRMINAKKKPDVVLYSNPNSFTQAQLNELKKKNIGSCPLAFNTHSNIMDSASAVGKDIIGDRSDIKGGYDAGKKAKEYISYCEDLRDEVQDSFGYFGENKIDYDNDYEATGRRKVVKGKLTSRGKYTLYVSQWNPDASISLSQGGKQLAAEQGLAYTENGYSRSPLSYYMSVGGVLNNAAVFRPSSIGSYAVIPFYMDTMDVSSSANIYSKTGSFVSYEAGETDINLGAGKFKYLVVDSKATRNAVLDSQSKTHGLWRVYPKIMVGSKSQNGYESGGLLVHSYISGNYDVLVNPSGVGDWADGSAESVLEAAWACDKFNGVGDVKSTIKDFYSKIYGYDLSESQIDNILNGSYKR
ncbi:MAG: hypothetical protein ACOX4I_02055 [Anaerovoracaceae bacterium]|jgi:hypothetical protein